MRCTYVVVGAGLREGDGLRLPLLQCAGIPFALFERRCRVLDITDIGEGHRGSRLYPGAAGPIGVFDVVVADLDRVAETAIDSCAAKGYAVSAVVVDRAGEVIVAMRADNAGPHTIRRAAAPR